MTAALEYAKALFALGEELGTTDAILSDLGDCEAAVSANPGYTAIIDSPALSIEERLSLLDEVFGKMDENLLSLIKILCEKRAFHLLGDLFSDYEMLYNEARGICRADVISATPLSDDQLGRIKDKISLATGKNIILKNTVDTSILGGIKLRYDGVQLDGSLRSRLQAIESRLKNTIL